MAKAKKKSVKKSARKSAKKAPARRSTRGQKAVVLTPDQRRAALRPPESYEDLVQRVIEVWAANPTLRVPGLTRAQLASKLAAALKAEEKERLLVAKQQAALRPVADARLLARDEVWRRLLDLNAAVKPYARVDPQLAEAFAFITDALRGTRAPREEPSEPTPS